MLPVVVNAVDRDFHPPVIVEGLAGISG